MRRPWLGTSGIVIFAFMGIESAVGPSGESARSIPHRAARVFVALMAVCLLYLAVQAVAQGILGPSAWEPPGLRRWQPPRVPPSASVAASSCWSARWCRCSGFCLARGSSTRGLSSRWRATGSCRDRLLACMRTIGRRTCDRLLRARRARRSSLTGTFERLLIISNIAALLVYGMVALAALSAATPGGRRWR